MSHRRLLLPTPQSRTVRLVGLCLLGVSLLGACSGRKVKEKLADKPYVKLSLVAQPVKKVYGTRWLDPEPVGIKVTLRNTSNYICDVLNRFIPAMPTEPGVISPLTTRVVYKATGKAIPLERFDDPDRPTYYDFVSFEARYAITAEVNLREYFPSMREPGAYTVWFTYRFGDEEARSLKADKQFKNIVPWTGNLVAAPVTVYLMGVPEPTPTPTPKPTPTPEPTKSGEKGKKAAEHGAAAPAHVAEPIPEKPTGYGSVIVPPPTPEPTPDPTPVPTPEPKEEHGGHGSAPKAESGHGGGGH